MYLYLYPIVGQKEASQGDAALNDPVAQVQAFLLGSIWQQSSSRHVTPQPPPVIPAQRSEQVLHSGLNVAVKLQFRSAPPVGSRTSTVCIAASMDHVPTQPSPWLSCTEANCSEASIASRSRILRSAPVLATPPRTSEILVCSCCGLVLKIWKSIRPARVSAFCTSTAGVVALSPPTAAVANQRRGAIFIRNTVKGASHSSATSAYLSMWATSSADGTQKLMSYSASV